MLGNSFRVMNNRWVGSIYLIGFFFGFVLCFLFRYLMCV